MTKGLVAAVTAAFLLATLASAQRGDDADEKARKPRYVPVRWEMLPVNPADVPGRCDASELAVQKRSFDIHPYKTEFAPDVPDQPVDVQIDGMLLGGGDDNRWLANVRQNPWPILYFVKLTDYYNHRSEIQARIEARIAQFKPEDRQRAFGNYAMAMVYLGEFKKIVAMFGPGAPGADAYKDNGEVNFSVAQALYRLGRYRESVPYSEKAYRQIKNAILDTRWQAMISAVATYGDAVWSRKSDIYDLTLARKLFPADKWTLPFEDATKTMGIDKDQWSGTGAAGFVDLDGDGWDDIVLERKYFPPKIYKNIEGRAFEPVPQEQLGGGKPICNQVITNAADIFNDGRPDLFRQCCNFDGKGPNSVLRNKGGMTFEDITRESGLSREEAGMAVCWLDYDLDGNIDVLVNDFRGATKLYRNRGDGTFEDVTVKAGLRTPGSYNGPKDMGAMGCAVGPLLGHRYPDIFVQGWGWRRLYANRGDGTFEDATETSGIGSGIDHMGFYPSLLDYNDDDKLDILSGSYVVTSDEKWSIGPTCVCSNLLSKDGFGQREWKGAPTIFRNNGDGTFTDMGAQTKFIPLGAMGYAHADWNNTGYEDIVMGCGGSYFQQVEPYLFYENNGDGTFTNKTPFLMLSLWGKGHGIGFGDYDHDGNLDLILNNGGAMPGDNWPSQLWHNKGGTGNHWVQISLKAGPGTNGSAIGSLVHVYAGPLKQVKILQSGGGLSVDSLELHFGLAKNMKIDKIVVEWPNRKLDTTTLLDVPVDRAIEIDERTGTYRTLWLPKPAVSSAGAAKKTAQR
jgi:hypothetical protein